MPKVYLKELPNMYYDLLNYEYKSISGKKRFDKESDAIEWARSYISSFPDWNLTIGVENAKEKTSKETN